MPAERDYASEIAQLHWDSAITQAYLNRHNDPWLEAAAAMDETYLRTGEHPLLRALRTREADPIFPSGGSPPGVNDMLNMRNGNNLGPNDFGMRGSTDQEPEAATQLDPKTLIGFVELALRNLNDPDERSEFLQELATLISGEQSNGGNGNYDQYGSTMPSSSPAPPPSYSRALDRRRGRTGGGRAQDRQIAQDAAVAALNHAGFLRRFPQTAHIRLTGNCR
jgi:hypothetical protein